MSRRRIMHMITPSDSVSPFDVNMAVDAGYEVIVPHCGVGESRVADFVQDAIFSRPPKSASTTGMFIGGGDINRASEMLEIAKRAMVPPFEVSVLADPNGAFTTSAALVAVIERSLNENASENLKGSNFKIFGGGPVGLSTAILAKERGASVSLIRLTASADDGAASEFAARFGVEIDSRRAVEQSERNAEAADAQVIVTTAKAGIQVLGQEALDQASELLIAADVNAVPPTGIEGVEVMHNGDDVVCKWGSFKSIGALGIGRVKYKTQLEMLKSMLTSEDSLVLGLSDAYTEAARHA